MRVPAVVTCVVALAALAGCTTSATPTGDIEATVNAFLVTCADRPAHFVLPQLTLPARDAFIHQPDTVSGCATILHVPPGPAANLSRDDFGRASAKVLDTGGASGRAAVHIAGLTQVIDLTFTHEGWEIEGPH